MSSPAQARGWRKGVRDAFQALMAVLAGGGVTVAYEAFVGTLDPAWTMALILVFKVAAAYSQNYLETSGVIGVMLPTTSVVVGAAGAVGTVAATADRSGEVAGDVLDTAGGVVGEVTGQLDNGKRN